MKRSEPLTIEDLRRPGAPAAITVRELRQVLGEDKVSTDVLYESIAKGTSPWRPLRVGRKILISTAAVLESLGIDACAQEPEE